MSDSTCDVSEIRHRQNPITNELICGDSWIAFVVYGRQSALFEWGSCREPLAGDRGECNFPQLGDEYEMAQVVWTGLFRVSGRHGDRRSSIGQGRSGGLLFDQRDILCQRAGSCK